MHSFESRVVVIVTDGGTGIGRAMALEFATHSARLELASPSAAWVTGQVMGVDDGLSIA
ncbi:MAG: hypothetical protein ACREVV_00450 [Steroidobacteraceae bacterium]